MRLTSQRDSQMETPVRKSVRKYRTLFVVALLCASAARILHAAAPSERLLLWPDGAPGAVGTTDADRPSLTVYVPEEPSALKTALVICPGGGYGHLAVDHEGRQIAEWANGHGMTAFVLRYRIAPRYQHPAPLDDVSRALRIVRAGAQKWNVDSNRIGVIGFSAGGHLASSLATHFDAGDGDAAAAVDRVGCRPDFVILGYPVISFTEPFTHAGSRRNLLGDHPSPDLVRLFSNELQVTAETPPTFLFHTADDAAVPDENSIAFYRALRAAGVPAELHIYRQGPHGVGLGHKHPELASWPDLCADWLASLDFLEPKQQE